MGTRVRNFHAARIVDQQRSIGYTPWPMTLKQLLAVPSHGDLEQFQRWRKSQFWDAIAQSPLRRWSPGDLLPTGPLRLLIGLAPSYSGPDIELADFLIDNAQHRNDIQVDVFDMTDLKDMSDVERYIPGMKLAYQTPTVAFWNQGHLNQSAEGAAGRKLIREVLIAR